ncbi:MAG: small subunit ribosomal protein [Solirubrobacteraceae bacterium]|nr:small subunit ribosomal protein [Solirubrobacteraceae bacterium]
MADEERPEEESQDEPKPTEEEQAPAAEEEQAPAAEEETAPAEEEAAPAPEAEAEAEAPAPDAEPEAPEAEAPEPAAPTPDAEAEAPEAEAEAETTAEPPAEAASAPAPGPTAEKAEPAIPGADLEVDIVPEGIDPLGSAAEAEAELEAPPESEAEPTAEQAEPVPAEPPKATIDLAADARYTATGKRKTAIARVILKPGQGEYLVNGRELTEHFPRQTAQRNIRQPLETVGYESRMDVVASLHGGGISAQAGALRHGIARALIEADPNLRGELKRRGFLTRDPRVKERKKAGLKKARKRPQFSKR